MFVFSFARANIIALIPLVKGERGAGVLEIWARGSGVYFGASSGKEKWSAPLYHCMRTEATLERLDYPNQRDVFILVLSVTVMYTVQQAEDKDWTKQNHVLSYNCQLLSNFQVPLLKAQDMHTLTAERESVKAALTSAKSMDEKEGNPAI